VSTEKKPSAADSAPNRLGRYELLATVGSGGMAKVYLGRARGVGGFERLVAVKVCHDHLLEESHFVDMFLDEARLAARIHHPNVVATLDVAHDEHLYMVMDYVEGGSLSSLIKAHVQMKQKFPADVVLRIMCDALRGLHAAHELVDNDGRSLNLIHRDISPQNILVGTDGITRITDFGVAKAEASVASTKPGEIKGKFAYLAPEQIRGLPLTRQVDVFAAAVVLWQALTGKKLFRADTPTETLTNILSGPILSVSAFRDDITEALDKVVRDGLERDPTRRFATAELFAKALEGCGVDMAKQEEVGRVVANLLGTTIAERRAQLRSGASSACAEDTPSVATKATQCDQVPTKVARKGIVASWKQRLAIALIALFAVISVMLFALGRNDDVPQSNHSGPSQFPAVVASSDISPSPNAPIRQTESSDADVEVELGEQVATVDSGIDEAGPARRHVKRRRPRSRKTAVHGKSPRQPSKGEPSFSAL
jgi:serine/threonine protein kinase